MKYWLPGLIIGIAFMALMMFISPQSCSDKIKPLQKKSDRSLIIDSLQKIETSKVKKESDSLISELKKQDSIQKVKIENLSTSYYALRAKLKHLKAVKVDSLGQTINVPVIEYNASINSSTMCDSLLMYLDSELMLKDSIISVQEIQVKTLDKKVVTSEQALTDLIALNNEERKQKEKAKKLNKKIPLLCGISSVATVILTILLLK